MSVRILLGDARAVLATLPDESVHCVVTSPPYFGLRDYGVAGQIGLEPTPAEFVAVMVELFREVRRVMRPDATLWLNFGDSYATGTAGDRQVTQTGKHGYWENPAINKRVDGRAAGFKPKDLMGIPWMVAKALQAPYYTGKIKDERDRIWLAAMIDGEGCFFIHKRKAGSSAHSKFTKADGTESSYSRTADTYGVGLEICNTSKALIDRVAAIVGGGTFTSQGPEQNGRRKQTIYRWRVAPNEAKRIAQEVYPHLISKQHQARLIINCPSSGVTGAAAHQAMMDLHNGVATAIDYPEPASLFEPGFYLRQDIIWAKNNPMPESVTDRCTKAHEYLFLLSKSARYHYDAEAIAEVVAESTVARLSQDVESQEGSDRVPGKTNGRMKAAAPRFGSTKYGDSEDPKHRTKSGNPYEMDASGKRNRRSVWTVATQPFKEAHFATFPPDLIEPCIKAGCPKDCCAKCGAPLIRQTFRPEPPDSVFTKTKAPTDDLVNRGFRDEGVKRGSGQKYQNWLNENPLQTIGWSPSCSCDAGLARGVCLDPFGGAGTTGLVADRLQRDAILIELNPAYCTLAADRITDDAPLFAMVGQ